MNDNSSVDLESSAADDSGAGIDVLRLNCIAQIISARPITVRLVAALLAQGSQPEAQETQESSCRGEGRRRVKPSRVAATVLVAIFVGTLAGCDWSKRTVVDLGLVDAPAPPPLAVEVLCDGSRGSTCSVSTLALVLNPTLTAAASRPGSIVRLWMQGSTVDRTRIVWAATSLKPQRSGRRAVQDEESRWVAKSLRDALLAARPSLGCRGVRSPIAETVTRVSLATAPQDAERWIVVLSDGLEVSDFANFECANLPRASTFVQSLGRKRVLGPDSLAGIHVRMCFLDLGPVDGDRCPMTVARALGVRALWAAALAAAGSRDVQVTDGAPTLSNAVPQNRKGNNP